MNFELRISMEGASLCYLFYFWLWLGGCLWCLRVCRRRTVGGKFLKIRSRDQAEEADEDTGLQAPHSQAVAHQASLAAALTASGTQGFGGGARRAAEEMRSCHSPVGRQALGQDSGVRVSATCKQSSMIHGRSVRQFVPSWI